MHTLRTVFREAFIENCQLERAPATPQELAAIDRFDEAELASNAAQLVQALLQFKRDVQRSQEPVQQRLTACAKQVRTQAKALSRTVKTYSQLANRQARTARSQHELGQVISVLERQYLNEVTQLTQEARCNLQRKGAVRQTLYK